ncbi:hypothetical protein [Promicromonospora aerolata]|uniref:Uncharacterized protein n=1 Tax=Promicromonospora aerolata TaxID=195749 RepID=A0ABW4VCC9_9MICO
MRTHVGLAQTEAATPTRRSRLLVTGVVLAMLLPLVLGQLLAAGHDEPLSSTTSTTPTAGVTPSPSEAQMLDRAGLRSVSVVPAARSSEAATSEHHPTVAGVPTPIAVPVGAIVLVLVALLAVTALTRRRHYGADPGKST